MIPKLKVGDSVIVIRGGMFNTESNNNFIVGKIGICVGCQSSAFFSYIIKLCHKDFKQLVNITNVDHTIKCNHDHITKME